jgi:hypothetical protein
MKATRKQMASIVEEKGGVHAPKLLQSTNYLVVGSGSNPCWAFSCYGRKIEEAMKLRQGGLPIIIVHESDFWDSLC